MKHIKVSREVLWSAFVTLSAIDVDNRDEQWEVAIEGIKAALNKDKELTKQQQELLEQREMFEDFVLQYTGRDMEYHSRYGTTGLEVAWACWQSAMKHQGDTR